MNEFTTKTNADLYPITSPNGRVIYIPNDYDPDVDVYSNLKNDEDIRKYYRTNGYVIRRNVIPPELCDEVHAAFENEIKAHKGFIYRQASANPEKHNLTAHGHMLNAVMNIQDLETSRFGRFQKLGMELLTHRNIRAALDILMQVEPVLAQTMFFEGNPATWPHQDKDYLDSNKPGAMVAAWIAVEDIKPGAGRFYVYPGSHNIDIEKIGSDVNIILDREAYKKLVVDTINQYNLTCTAPAMKKGDVLFWHGKTIHGSLPTTQPEYSRSSFTAHYIPDTRSLLQLQVRQKKLILREVNGMKVNFPKDQNLLVNKMVFLVETKFPTLFRKIKRGAIKLHKGK